MKTIEAMKQIAAQLDADGHYELARFQQDAIAAEEAKTKAAEKWPIAGIKVKIDGSGPNFHLYRLLGANDLAPGEYELFTRPAPPPAGERGALIAKLRDIPPNPFRLMMWEAAEMLAADAQDAERYRWLRSIGGKTWSIVDDPKNPRRATGEYYDIAVDDEKAAS